MDSKAPPFSSGHQTQHTQEPNQRLKGMPWSHIFSSVLPIPRQEDAKNGTSIRFRKVETPFTGGNMARNAILNLQLAAQNGLDRDTDDIPDAPTLAIGELFDVALHLLVNLQRDIALLFHARHYIIR